MYHFYKTNRCNKQGIQLIHIFEDEWINKHSILKSIIKSKLGIYDKRIYARKCIVKEIDTNDYKLFLEKNHLKGYSPAEYRFGLYYNNELVQVVGFNKNKNGYILDKSCSKLNTQIIGGLSKLIKHFGRNNIETLIDLSLYNGNCYLKCGFNIIEKQEPNCFYIESGKNFYKQRFKEKILKDKQYYKIWDCGQLRLIFNN